MEYINFLNLIKNTIINTLVNGTQLAWYSEICLEDEIELKTGTTYPAIFIVPIPFDIIDDMMVKYSCKVYLVDNVTRAPNYNMKRFNVYNKMVNYAMAFLQRLPDENINDYPVTINPVVKWDANIDGIYFELTVNSNIGCL